MDPFRLLTRTRQVTEYSCGACALQAVLSYWGKDVDEAELMKLLHTTSEDGTYPEDIVKGARALGFEAEARDHLTLDDVAEFTASGNPVIALAQVWRSEKNSPASVADDWDSGHYIVVLGVDEDYVYFQDPYARMGKAFTPRKSFVEHWHHAMGGARKDNPRLMQLAIFVRGAMPARRNAARDLHVSASDLERFGSLNLLITQFPRLVMPYDFLDELRGIWAGGSIRPSAFILLGKDKDGNVTGMEGSHLSADDDIAAMNAVIAAIASRSIDGPDFARTKVEAAITTAAEGDFGLSARDIHRIAEQLPPDHSAIVLILENAWERTFKEIAARHHGAVTDQRLITPAALAKAAKELSRAEHA